MTNVVRLRPRTYTSHEEFLDTLREAIFACGKTYKQLALECRVSHSTIGNFAMGRTRWPRPTTLFPLLEAVGLQLKLVRE